MFRQQNKGKLSIPVHNTVRVVKDINQYFTQQSVSNDYVNQARFTSSLFVGRLRGIVYWPRSLQQKGRDNPRAASPPAPK